MEDGFLIAGSHFGRELHHAMKTLVPLVAVAAFSMPVFSAPEPAKKPDLIESGLRQVLDEYLKGNDEAVVEKLRILIKMMAEKDLVTLARKLDLNALAKMW